MKPDATPLGAMVYADWLEDNDQPAESTSWRMVGKLQEQLVYQWKRFGGYWTATELRRLHMHNRTKGRTFPMDGKTYLVRGLFAAREVFVDLYVPTAEGSPERLAGKLVLHIAGTSFRRTTLAKDGVDVVMRRIALKLLQSRGKSGK